MDAADDKKLINMALKAREYSYCNYSGYAVGAALLDKDGRMFLGCNVENASYGATICAERNAIFQAVSQGSRVFSAIAIAGGPKDGEISEYAFPCGMCRQVMDEFCGSDFRIIVAKSDEDYQVYSLKELMPHGFSLKEHGNI